ncbi:cytochrome c biogenesis protein DipZ [Janthinobacterium agaricidamnosum]|uniref:AhpC/TSA family protein n=1 Tax=Janthinobacterium agaricidamnosum NBRC 102515 = DSM 9628 TaxID=1349767 RepID=W0V0Z4_9BURK|nr:cytochrome c biogenesis protein DipZ [Janthinobacterium agaricidamnosum]CDG82489.1 ahpC/TSA family protein [Janthinobacterium agaricidamnosum NBRC 102515 = DSM 9628]
MLLILLSFLGGALTIVSPCILPVLPFVFARSGQPFRRSGLPLLAGMALTFAAVATLAAVGGSWVVQTNQYGRWLALVLMAFFGVTLLFPHLAERLASPLVAAGDRLSRSAQDSQGRSSPAASLLLGVATGLLWAPCAGPILGLVLTGAALNGASIGTTLLLLAYAAGAATSLAIALLIGGKVFAAMKRSLGAGEWLRRGLGGAMLCGVAAIALGLDTGLLTQVSTVTTAGLEQGLLDRLSPKKEADGGAMMAANVNAGAMMSANLPKADAAGGSMMMMAAHAPAPELALPVEGVLPDLSGAVKWFNSAPLTAQQLKGKVVLVDFWTYSCINCLRTLPYVKAWAEKYRDQGLVVIGVHAPEFAFERDLGNVGKAVHELGVTYPVAVDNNYAIWRAMKNQYWPAHYFIDAQGKVRHHHFGEGEYAESEKVIQQLLAEAGNKNIASDVVAADAKGVQQAADMNQVGSPETYVGYERAQNFASAGGPLKDRPHVYAAPSQPALNQWGLGGSWTVKDEQATLDKPSGSIVYRFHARDLHLVLGPGPNGKPVRFRVSIDGAAPGADHGSDIGADGSGTVTGQRLYQLVRQSGPVKDRTFSIEFLDSGVQAYAFTFG